MATTLPPPSRIPVPRSFTAPTTPALNTFKSSSPPTALNAKLEKISASERKIAALSARITCSTPTFNQSTKFSHLASAHRLPESPMMQRGQGICNLWRYTDYKTTLAADESSPTASSSGSLSWKSSRFRLRMRRSKNSLRSSDGSSGSDCHSSRSSSPGSPLISEKALPPLPPLFSPCTSPMDRYYHDSDFAPVPVAAPPPRPRFRASRKPAPEYIPAIVLPTPGSPSSSRSGEISDPESTSALQNVGPNVFIAYDDDSSVRADFGIHACHQPRSCGCCGLGHSARPPIGHHFRPGERNKYPPSSHPSPSRPGPCRTGFLSAI
ncbi:hypothetical protein DFH09DRAFT_226684 [Mycena vulgaris]|nr:hypothetical protein DFH09DRAFT_226684 [Mycena vulgaris]